MQIGVSPHLQSSVQLAEIAKHKKYYGQLVLLNSRGMSVEEYSF